MNIIKSIKKDFITFKIDIEDLKIQTGVTCIMGGIGSGKSELLKLISGVNIVDSKEIGLIQDSIYSVEPSKLFGISLDDYIKIYKLSFESFDDTYFLNKLELFEIDSSVNVNSMSLGQKSIVSSLLSLSTNKDIVLIDEPFNNLDPMNRKRLRDCFIDAIDNKKTLILASNLIDEIERLADNIVLLCNGKVIAESKLEVIDDLRSWYKANH